MYMFQNAPCFSLMVAVATVQALELSAGSGLRGVCHMEPLPCSDASGGRVSHHEGVTLDTRHLKGTGGTEDQRKRERRGSSQGGGSVSGRAPREAWLRSVSSHSGATGTP
ncbi:unnamed protein product [Rangifer tarandus platyrhynchus]|uniref:Secreted protein n=1 Tax=Rangifer tarandus platyrhynchus TaxID=3082113 RepID=A0ABN8XUC4_RANTA|nr:unnamed protein product [Rangifer tarandus platyrhynchus]